MSRSANLPVSGGFWSGNFPALREAGLRRYLAGQFISYAAVWAQATALNLYVYAVTGSPWHLGLLNFLLYAPTLVVSPWAGSLLSHARLKRTLKIVLAMNASVSAALCWCVLRGTDGLALVLVLALVSGILGAIELPARLVLVQASVRDPALTSNAVSLNILGANIARMVGAPFGAFLYDGPGPAWAFVGCALALLLMVACVASMPKVHVEPATASAAGMLSGLRYARSNPLTSFYLPAIGAIGLFAASYTTMVPLLADAVFGKAAAYTGLFLGFAGAGSVIAALLLSSRLGSLVATPRRIRICQWVPPLGLAAIALGAHADFAAVVAISAAFLVLGLSISFTNAASCAAMLQQGPAHMRGTIAGLYSMAYAGVLPFGHVLWGGLSDRFGIRVAIAAMAGGLVVILGVIHWVHARSAGMRARPMAEAVFIEDPMGYGQYSPNGPKEAERTEERD